MKTLTKLMAAAFNKTAIALAAVAAPLMLPAAASAESFAFSYSTVTPNTRIVNVVQQPVYTHYYPQRVVVREQVAYQPVHVGYWGGPNTVVVQQSHWNNGRRWDGHRGRDNGWRDNGRDHGRGNGRGHDRH